MTQKELFQSATSSQQDTPVSLSHKPGSAGAKRMTATSGRTSARLLHAKDPLGAFSRMFMVTSAWASTRCWLTWKPMATPQGRLLYRLAVSMPRTEETGSGLLHTPTAKANQLSPSMLESGSGWWATPNTMDHLPQRSKESMDKMKDGARKGRTRPSNLREQVDPETMRMWATPRASDGTGGPRQLDEKGRRISKTNPDLKFGANLADQARMWPTPTANEDAAGTPNGKMQRMLGNHPDVRNTGAGTLNPQWVEWLMGYPEGWTDLKD